MRIEELNERTLDAALARHLFGFEVEEWRNARTGELDFVCRRAGQEWARVAFFSCANAILALAVEFKLIDLGWHLTPASKARRQATGRVPVVLERDGSQVEGLAETFEAGLCVAALKAVGRGGEVLRQEVEAWRAGQHYAAQRYKRWYSRYFSKHN